MSDIDQGKVQEDPDLYLTQVFSKIYPFLSTQYQQVLLVVLSVFLVHTSAGEIAFRNSISWDVNDQLFFINGVPYEEVILFRGFPYVFTNHSPAGIRLFIGDADFSSYEGNDLFNNDLNRTNDYLFWLPDDSTPNQLYALNPDHIDKKLSISVRSFIQKDLPFHNEPQGLWGNSVCFDKFANIFVGEPSMDGTAGRVHFYKQVGAHYELNQSVEVPNLGRTQFGSQINLGDSQLIVSAPDEASFSGAVYIFPIEDNSSNLADTYSQRLSDPSPVEGGLFGWQTSVFGNSLAVSSLDVGGSRGGEVFLFNQSDDWEIVKTIYSQTTQNDQEFGFDLSQTENFLAVSSPGFDSPFGVEKTGAVFVYDLKNADSVPYLISPPDLAYGDRFGHAVSLSGDFLFVGALMGDGQGKDTGVIYIYENNESSWNFVQKISPPSTDSDQLFSQQISAEGLTLVALAPNAPLGADAYIYKRYESVWMLASTINLSNFSDEDRNFLSLDFANEYVVIGNPNHDEYRGGVFAVHTPALGTIPDIKLPPVIAKGTPKMFTITEDSSSALTIDFNGSQPLDEPIFWRIVEDNASQATFSIEPTDGVFTYIPDRNFSGLHSFTLELNSSGQTSLNFFQVSVEPEADKPIFLNGYLGGVNFVEEGEFRSFTIGVFDSDDDVLSLEITDGVLPEGFALNGFKIEGVAPQDSASDQNFEVTLQVEDTSSRYSTAKFLVQVIPYNAPPQVAFEGVTLNQELALSAVEDFSLSSWLKLIEHLSISDSEGDAIYMEATTLPENGSLILSDIFTGLEDLKFFPDANFVGTNRFRIKLYNQNNAHNFQSLNFRVKTESVNDPPVIQSVLPPVEVLERELYLHQFKFSDADLGDLVTLSLSGLPSWLSFDGNSTIYGVPQRSDYLQKKISNIIAEVRDLSGVSFSQVFSIEIIPLNYPPIIIYEGNSTIKVVEDSDESARGVLEVLDDDTPVESLEWSVSKFPENGIFNYVSGDGNFSFDYQPKEDFFGSDEFIIKVSDPADPLSVATIQLQFDVSNIPDYPQFVSEPYPTILNGTPWQYDIHVKDPDGDTGLTLEVLTELPSWLTLRQKTGLRWTLSGIAPGDVPEPHDLNLSLKLSDPEGHETFQSFSLQFVDQIENLQIAQFQIGEQVINEDQIWTGGSLSTNSTPGRKVNWVIIEEPEFGEFLFDETDNGSIQNITYVPDENFHGSDSLVIQASDGFSSDLRSFSFRVLSISDRPRLTFYEQNLILEDRDYLDTEIIFEDGDGMDNLSYFSSEIPDWVSEDLSQLGSGIIRFSGSPGVENIGDYSIHIVLDGRDDGLSLSHDLNFSVVLLNRPPVVSPESLSITMQEDNPVTWVVPKLFASDDETSDQKDLLWQVSEPPENGVATIDFSGSNFRYVPDGNFSGTDYITLRVSDTGGENGSPPRFTEIPVEVTVTPSDDPPVILTSPPSDRPGKICWTDEFPYLYEFASYDSDWSWQGYPTVRLLTPLPTWAKWEDRGDGSVLLYGEPSFLDVGNFPFLIEVSSGEVTLIQSFDLEIRVDDFPPEVRFSDSQEYVLEVQTFLVEDSVNQEAFNEKFRFKAYNLDQESDDFDSLKWSVGEMPVSGGDLNVSGEGDQIEELYYMPPKDYHGVDEFSIQVSEGDRKTNIPVKVYIRSVPDPPYFITEFNDRMEAKLGEFFSFEVEVHDPENEEIEFKIFTNNVGQTPWIHILSENPKLGLATIGGTPPPSTAVDSVTEVTIVATDSSGRFTTAEIEISYVQINRPPQILAGDKLTIFFDQDFSTRSSTFFPLLAQDPEQGLLDWRISETNQPNFGEILLIEDNGSVEAIRYIPSSNTPVRDDFTLVVSDGELSTEILINAYFNNSEFFINFPDQLPLLFENKSFEIQFFVQGSANVEDDFSATFIEGPSWASVEPRGSNNFVLRGVPQDFSAGTHSTTVKVTHPNGLAEQTLKFDLEVRRVSLAKLSLVGSRIMPVQKGLIEGNFSEPGYFAQSALGEDVTNQVQVDFPTIIEEGLNQISYSVDELSDQRILIGHESTPFLGFHETRENENFIQTCQGGTKEKAYLLAVDSSPIDREENSPVLSDGYVIYSTDLERQTPEIIPFVYSSRSIVDISDFVFFDNHILVAGEHLPSAQNPGHTQTFFVDCYDLDGTEKWGFEWLVNGVLDDLRVTPSGLDGIMIHGNLEGELKLGSVSVSSDSKKCTGFILNREGSVIQNFNLEQEDVDHAVSLYFQNEWFFLVRSTNLTNSQLYKMNSLGELSYLKTFADLRVTDFTALGDGMFLWGRVKNESTANESDYLLVKILDSGDIIWQKSFTSQSGESEISEIICSIDGFGRLNFAFEFKGNISYQGTQFSSASRGLGLLSISGMDGSYLWSDSFDGGGEESLLFAFSDEGGISHLGIRSSDSAIAMNQAIEAHLGVESSMLTLIPKSTAPQLLNSEPLVFEVDRFTSHSIEFLNSGLTQLYLVDAPKWVKLINNSGSFSLSGFPGTTDYVEAKSVGQSIKVRVVGPNYNSQVITISILINHPDEQRHSSSLLPSLSSFSYLAGNGDIISTSTLPTGHIVAGNYNGTIGIEDQTFSTLARSAGFVFYLSSDFRLYKGFNFSGSGSCSIVEMTALSSSEVFVVGQFRGTLKVGSSSIISNGGTDLFLAVINLNSNSVKLHGLGGGGDEFSTDVCIGGDSVYIGGYYYGNTEFGYHPLYSYGGGKEAFVAKLNKENLSRADWLFSFGGQGQDSLQDLAFCEDHLVAVANFNKQIYMGEKVLETAETSNSVIIQLGLDGSLSNYSVLKSKGSVFLEFVEFLPSDEVYTVAGYFNGEITSSSKLLHSNNQDIFIGLFDKELNMMDANNYGGAEDQTLSSFDITEHGLIYFAGDFSKSVELSQSKISGQGSSDAFFAMVDSRKLDLQDYTFYQSDREDTISSISCIDNNQILISGKGLGLNVSNDVQGNNAFIASYSREGAGPAGSLLRYGNFRNNSQFKIPFTSYGWIGRPDSYFIERASLPPWISVTVDGEGNGFLSGFSPLSDDTYPVSFLVKSNDGQSALIEGAIETRNEFDVPNVIFPQSVEVKQFDFSRVEFSVENISPERISYAVDIPEWAELKIDRYANPALELLPMQGATGRHNLRILVQSKDSGLFELVEMLVNVTPSDGYSFGGSPISFNQWENYWLGTLMIKENAWAYHLNLGWIYLQLVTSSPGAWMWVDTWGWLWTEEDIWSGSDGYIYSSALSTWVYFTDKLNDSPMIYNFSDKKWINFR